MKSQVEKWIRVTMTAVLAVVGVINIAAQSSNDAGEKGCIEGDGIRKVLYIGDSMTGWLSERLNAYGAENGFEVAAVVWDGSTIRKWGNSGKLKALIDRHKPDVVFVSLGLNELLEPNPEKRLGPAVDNIIKAVGNRRLVWVGPPTWPGRGKGEKLTGWLSERLGEDRYFDSTTLELKRQGKTNPHPTREAVSEWTDSLVEWINSNPALDFGKLNRPVKKKMLRGRSFTYIRMKGSL